jgi:methyl-accepting chemotaxis protein
MLSRKIWKVIARLRGIVMTEMKICETVERVFAIATEELLIFLMIRLTAESPLEIVEKILEIAARTGALKEKIIRILEEIGMTTRGIFRVIEDTEVTIKEIFRAIEDTKKTTEEVSGIIVVTDAITEEISGVKEDTEVTIEEIFKATEDSGEIIKEIFEPIVKLKGITNDIIPHAQIIGSDILPSVTAINIQVNHTEKKAGVKLTDAKFFRSKKAAT